MGEVHLGGFVDRVSAVPGLAVPLAAACAAIMVVLAAAAARHLRQALALQPVEALG
jgi:putative ABC transport system permease protein